ncbi:two-component system regulatory protein YycI [Tepidibacillus fermentans]|uniref:Regulatory protein YycI of two-component signal transduction system YycFG n=1 Tax=Tepidibacillus fermentans TaxID=1281767 RepID=A0A4R3KCR9_9BACI|nr:two-component system regulatory protein YycI [Tepidibacillus fermentans]TCS80783.1 regulatory protein YycI of two-component signal transduction system YycFG [Tepidibacillus fermentans]
MDWGKTKTIFIFTFFILNLVLGYQIYLKQKEYLQDIQSTNSIQELNHILRLQGIKLTYNLPKEIPELHFIQVKEKKLKRNEIKEPIKLEQPYNSKLLNAKLQKTINHFSEYDYDSQESSSNRLVFHQRIEDFPYFSDNLILQISKGKVISYQQEYYEMVDKGPTRQVISAHSALRTALDYQYIPNGSEIKEMKLGFYKQDYPEDIQILVPVWRIVYQDSERRGMIYIHAMTGGVEGIH